MRSLTRLELRASIDPEPSFRTRAAPVVHMCRRGRGRRLFGNGASDNDVLDGQGRHSQTRGEARPAVSAMRGCIAKVPDVAEGAEHRSCAMIAFLRY